MKNLREKVVGDKKIIVVLTSFPPRIGTVHIPIKRMLRNKIQPDKVILYLATSQFPNKLDDVSEKLRKLLTKDSRFEIRFLADDKRQFKGVVTGIKEYPNDFIINIDDDVYYPRNLIKHLLKRAAKYPGCIIARRARYALFDKQGNLKPYKKWRINTFFGNWLTKGSTPRFRNLPTQVGGVLYPPNSLHKDIVNEELFNKYKPASGDVWFWIMAIRNGTKIAISSMYVCYFAIPGTVKSGLWRTLRNHKRGTVSQKDLFIQKVMVEYPDVWEAIRNEK